MSLTRFRCANSLQRGRAGIEPATSPTRRENHTSRPTALVSQASNEDRTRDLLLTRQMLCQLSYRGESTAPPRFHRQLFICSTEKKNRTTSERFELPRESSQLISNQSP